MRPGLEKKILQINTQNKLKKTIFGSLDFGNLFGILGKEDFKHEEKI